MDRSAVQSAVAMGGMEARSRLGELLVVRTGDQARFDGDHVQLLGVE